MSELMDLLAKTLASPEVATALVGAVVAALGAFRKQIAEKAKSLSKKGRKDKKDQETVADIRKMYETRLSIHETINDMLRDTSANRVLILKSENGGGIPSTHSSVKLTILYEARDAHLPSIQANWVRRPSDANYERMLINLLREGMLVLSVADMPESELKRVYNAQGIVKSVVFLLGFTNKEYLLFMSANLTENDDSDELLATMEAGKHRLQTLLNTSKDPLITGTLSKEGED